MDNQPIVPTLSVAEVLQLWPQTIPVFLKYRMSCIGCELADYEYLADAARIYGLAVEKFLDELNQVVEDSEA